MLQVPRVALALPAVLVAPVVLAGPAFLAARAIPAEGQASRRALPLDAVDLGVKTLWNSDQL